MSTLVPTAMAPSRSSNKGFRCSSWPLSEITWSCTAKQPLRSACEPCAMATTRLPQSTESPSPSGVRTSSTIFETVLAGSNAVADPLPLRVAPPCTVAPIRVALARGAEAGAAEGAEDGAAEAGAADPVAAASSTTISLCQEAVLYSCVWPSSKAIFTLSGVPSAYIGWPWVAPWKDWTTPSPCLGCSILAPTTKPAPCMDSSSLSWTELVFFGGSTGSLSRMTRSWCQEACLYSWVWPLSNAIFTLSGVPSAYIGWPWVAPVNDWTIPGPCVGCSTLIL